MYSLILKFNLPGKRNNENARDSINSYLAALRMNGQIIDSSWPIYFKEKSFFTNVLTPERTSLNHKNDNKYVKESKAELTIKGLSIPYSIVNGRDIDSAPVGNLSKSDFFFLYTNYVTLESSIRDSSNFNPIPLYKLPKTYDDEYYDIICWQSDYKYCDGLQMGCKTGERFATKELTLIDSSLSKRGIEICKKLSKSVNKPFYYYLYKGSCQSNKDEENRFCPGCGNKKWKLKTPLHNIFDFKCDKCKIVSNIAWNLRK
jgi:predicted  nucleic acid-binding Zn ribbon protein